MRHKLVQDKISSKRIPSKQDGIINICELNGDRPVNLVELVNYWAEVGIIGEGLEDFSTCLVYCIEEKFNGESSQI